MISASRDMGIGMTSFFFYTEINPVHISLELSSILDISSSDSSYFLINLSYYDLVWPLGTLNERFWLDYEDFLIFIK